LAAPVPAAEESEAEGGNMIEVVEGGSSLAASC